MKEAAKISGMAGETEKGTKALIIMIFFLFNLLPSRDCPKDEILSTIDNKGITVQSLVNIYWAYQFIFYTVFSFSAKKCY